MGKLYSEIDDELRAFISRQHVFFVATAPLTAEGHVNVSPKGLDTFRILGPKAVAYLDLTGSGIETVAHLRENGRVTIMFCAFEGKPRILRLFGRGRVLEPEDAEWNRLASHFAKFQGTRSIVLMEVERIADSCGYGVPLFEYQRDRTQLLAWAENKGKEGLDRYKAETNSQSIDGLPGLGDPLRPSGG